MHLLNNCYRSPGAHGSSVGAQVMIHLLSLSSFSAHPNAKSSILTHELDPFLAEHCLNILQVCDRYFCILHSEQFAPESEELILWDWIEGTIKFVSTIVYSFRLSLLNVRCHHLLAETQSLLDLVFFLYNNSTPPRCNRTARNWHEHVQVEGCGHRSNFSH